jgi:hypothetical protein
MANTKRTIEEIRATEGQTLTPYEVFRVLQHQVEQVSPEAAAKLRPQMMYNYDRNGGIVKGYTQESRDGLAGRYTVEQADQFVQKYIAKNGMKWFAQARQAATVDPFANVNEISQQLRTEEPMLEFEEA